MIMDPPTAPSSVAPPWLDELDLAVGPPIHKMGLRSLPPTHWLVVDDLRPSELTLKAELLASRHGETFAAAPDTESSSIELTTLVLEHLADAHGLDGIVPDADLHPLDALGRVIQEDLVLMRPGDDGYVLAAASLCFPSGWRLADKFGLPMRAIHGPVTRYEDELSNRADRFFERLVGDRIVWRRNWFLHNHPNLFAPSRPRPGPEVNAGNVDTAITLRTERQTLRRLTTDDIVFTIRTEQVALESLRTRPDIAERMAVYLRDSPDDAVAGKGVIAHVGVVLDALDRYAGGGGVGGGGV